MKPTHIIIPIVVAACFAVFYAMRRSEMNQRFAELGPGALSRSERIDSESAFASGRFADPHFPAVIDRDTIKRIAQLVAPEGATWQAKPNYLNTKFGLHFRTTNQQTINVLVGEDFVAVHSYWRPIASATYEAIRELMSEGRRKRPNKSPEPTPTAVTPRATEPKAK